MSIYPSPKTRNGSLNLIFNNTDYIQTASAGSGGLTIAQNDARYLRNSGTVVSSGSTTFNSSVNIAGLATIDNLDISGLLNTKKQADTLVSASFSASQTYSFNDAMIYTLASNDTPMTSLSINDIPTTPLKSYKFTFIIKPDTLDSPFYLKPNKNVISVNNESIPLYGLENISLPATYTYLIQEIKVINTSTTATPSFSAFTNVSGFGYTPPPSTPLIISTILTDTQYGGFNCLGYDSNGILYLGSSGIIQKYVNNTLISVIGNRTSGNSGDGGQGSNALIGNIFSIKFDSKGNLFFTDNQNHVIRKMDLNGIITTIAGTGTSGTTTNGIQANTALLNQPRSLIFDQNDNMYFSSYGNKVINKIDTTGIITTIAGTSGTSGFTSTTFSTPTQLAFDKNESFLFVADRFNNAIRKVDINSGAITTVAGNGSNGSSGDGSQATSAVLSAPVAMLIDLEGNIIIGEFRKVRKVDLNGIITTIAGTGNGGNTGDGGNAIDATFGQVYNLAFDSIGNIILADLGNKSVRKITY
jgi:hypothetical protein